MNSKKQVSLKRLKIPKRSKLTHLPSTIVTSPQINSKVVTLDSNLSNGDSITKMKGEYRTFAANYFQALKDLFTEVRCNSIEDYL